MREVRGVVTMKEGVVSTTLQAGAGLVVFSMTMEEAEVDLAVFLIAAEVKAEVGLVVFSMTMEAEAEVDLAVFLIVAEVKAEVGLAVFLIAAEVKAEVGLVVFSMTMEAEAEVGLAVFLIVTELEVVVLAVYIEQKAREFFQEPHTKARHLQDPKNLILTQKFFVPSFPDNTF
jgi:hypothetical protein